MMKKICTLIFVCSLLFMVSSCSKKQDIVTRKDNPSNEMITTLNLEGVKNGNSLIEVDNTANEYYDIYISLRTYNSSFFDITKAIIEAKRIMKHGAIIIISVANGFLSSEKKCIIPGLLIPGTEFVDIYRGMEMTRKIKREYLKAGFKNIQLIPTNTEIYIAGVVA